MPKFNGLDTGDHNKYWYYVGSTEHSDFYVYDKAQMRPHFYRYCVVFSDDITEHNFCYNLEEVMRVYKKYGVSDEFETAKQPLKLFGADNAET